MELSLEIELTDRRNSGECHALFNILFLMFHFLFFLFSFTENLGVQKEVQKGVHVLSTPIPWTQNCMNSNINYLTGVLLQIHF